MATQKKPTQTNSNLDDTIERLERRLAQAVDEHQRLHDAVILAGHRAQVAKWSLTTPPGFDQMPASDRYRWLQANTPVGISSPSAAGEAAYLNVCRQVLAPLQQEEQAASKAVADARSELAQARNEHDLLNFDQVSGNVKQQLKLARAAAKQAADTVTGINKQITTGEIDRMESLAELDRLDEQQAQAIAAGQSIDDEAHVLAQARVMTLERRLKVTRAAAQQAANKAAEATNEVKRLEAETKRLKSVKDQHNALVKLKSLSAELTADGVPNSTLEDICRRISSTSLESVLSSLNK